jgi:hypothetical protein
MRPPRPIFLRGEELLCPSEGALATAHYELWLRLPAPGTERAEPHPHWMGTVQLVDVEAGWSATEWLWLHLVSDRYRLAVRLEGSGPQYLAVGLSGLQPDGWP